MKIGLLSQWYDPEPGGGVIPGVLARNLSARGHDLRVLTGFPNYPTGVLYPGYQQRWHHEERQPDGVTVFRAPLLPSHDASALRRAANYLSFGVSASVKAVDVLADRDVLWVYNSPAPVGAAARRLARKQRVPYLLHVMDLWPDSVLESGMLSGGLGRLAAERLLTGVVDRTYEGASVVAVTSPGQVSLLAGRGVPESKLRYIPVWADEKLFFPRPASRHLLPTAARDAEVVVMYAGAMGHVQSLDVAVRAAVKAAATGLHLVLVGSGVAEQGLRQLAAELAAGNVHFMGHQPPEVMGELSAAADIHLVSLADSPLLRVTMPSKVQAIMALGRPIVALCAGDAAHVVREAGAGRVVAPGDESQLTDLLRQLRGQQDQLHQWGRAARHYYERQFGLAEGVRRVEEALRDVATGVLA